MPAWKFAQVDRGADNRLEKSGQRKTPSIASFYAFLVAGCAIEIPIESRFLERDERLSEIVRRDLDRILGQKPAARVSISSAVDLTGEVKVAHQVCLKVIEDSVRKGDAEDFYFLTIRDNQVAEFGPARPADLCSGQTYVPLPSCNGC